MKSKAQMIKEFTKGRAEIDLLERIAVAERKVVASQLNISVDALGKRLETIRRHAVQYEWYSEQVKRLKKHFPYIAGVLAPQKPTTLEEEELGL